MVQSSQQAVRDYTADYGKCYSVGSNPYPAVKTCEKFDMANNRWGPLPDMKEARSCFNPCLFYGIIYLCGCGSTIMEAFSPETDTFLPVQIPVPSTSNCCSYVDDDQLVLHMTSSILKFAAGQGGQLVKRSEIGSPGVHKYQNSQPVVNKASGLYFITWNGSCLRFNMETGAQGPSI